jgi:hypothetical protein
MLALDLDIIPAANTKYWHKVLSQFQGFDFYHLPEYHLLAEEEGEGKGILLVYREGPRIVAWPFLLRPVESIVGLESIGQGLQDATSVYGYPGPIWSSKAQGDFEFANRFSSAMKRAATDLKLVCLFSRLNPLLGNASLLQDFGTLLPLGKTVSIDLALDTQVQWSSYRKSHRYEIRKARNIGLRAYRDASWSQFDKFLHLYTLTMEKKKAKQRYFFDRHYFLKLREALGERLQLFVAEHNHEICSAALFVHTGDIIQYHLSGSAPECAKFAPSKLVIDEARIWGNDQKACVLHLGGGVGSRKDGLFKFKAGFSPKRHRFFVWHWIVLPEIYEQLVETRRALLDAKGKKTPSTSFFPLYRAG